MDTTFDKTARFVVHMLSRDELEMVAEWLAGDPYAARVLDTVTLNVCRQAISQLFGAVNVGPPSQRALAAAHLRALAEEKVVVDLITGESGKDASSDGPHSE